MLESDPAFEVASVSMVHEALRAAAADAIDLILFEYDPCGGTETCRLLAGARHRPRLIALAGRADQIDPGDPLAAGADAAVALDSMGRAGLLAVIARVLDGQSGFVGGFPNSRPEAWNGPGDEGPAALLTRRERELLYLIGEGLSNREIADILVVSIKTVEAHRANLARKVGLSSRAGLMRLALAGSAG
jgi:DNA-binding NarL/FixJ family response regulator